MNKKVERTGFRFRESIGFAFLSFVISTVLSSSLGNQSSELEAFDFFHILIVGVGAYTPVYALVAALLLMLDKKLNKATYRRLLIIISICCLAILQFEFLLLETRNFTFYSLMLLVLSTLILISSTAGRTPADAIVK